MYYFIILAIIVLISITCLKNSVAKKGILVVVFISAIIGGIIGGIIEGAIIRTSEIKAENITTTSKFEPYVIDSIMTEDCIIREKVGILKNTYSLSDIRGGDGLEHKIIIVNDSLRPGILTIKKTLAHRVLPGIPSFKMTLESKNYVVLPKKQYEVFKSIENHAREREDSLAKAKESV